MNTVDLSQVRGAPAGYSGPPARAYEKDPDTPYYEDERAGIEYKEYNGLKGLTQEAYDARVAAKEKSNAFKKQIQDGIDSRPAPETPAPEEEGGGGGGGKAPVIDVVDQTVDGTNNKVDPAPGGGGNSGGGTGGGGNGKGKGKGKGPGGYYDGSFSAGDITQNVGKVGDMKTTIKNSEIGDDSYIGNDMSETTGANTAGNTNVGPTAPGANGMFGDTDLSFSSGDIDQNVGKTGDMETTIKGSTIGENANIGNDYSETYGSNYAGNQTWAKAKAKAYGFAGNGELRFT